MDQAPKNRASRRSPTLPLNLIAPENTSDDPLREIGMATGFFALQKDQARRRKYGRGPV
jgi:hypothetical protein